MIQFLKNFIFTALNSNNVWAEGLLIFYEIFKFLEDAMKEKSHENLGKLAIDDMYRTEAFEKDLDFYLGQDWRKTYIIRSSVKNYLNHLETLLTTNSNLLMAYVYHLYMGLFSGGQILKKKRQLQGKLLTNDDGEFLGNAVTEFTVSISDLKKDLKGRMNEIAEKLDDNTKNLLVQESIKVFELNNSIIKTVKGTSFIAFKNIVIFASLLALVLSFIYYNFIRIVL